MNKLSQTYSRRRRAYAATMLAVFLISLPLSAFPAQCCCSAAKAPTSEMSCHQSKTTAQTSEASCHSSTAPSKTESTKAGTSTCSSDAVAGESVVVSLQVNQHNCQAECDNQSKSVATATTSASVRVDFPLAVITIAEPGRQLKFFTANYSTSLHKSRSLLSYHLFLQNSSFLI